MKHEFKGMFPAPPTPSAPMGGPREGLRALLEDNIAHGANGFWMAGTTGEGPILTEEQRDAVARISAEVCKGRVPVIMHVGAISTASAVRAAKTARSAGCDAVCCCRRFSSRAASGPGSSHYKRGGRRRRTFRSSSTTSAAHPGRDGSGADGKFVRAIPTLKGLKHSAPNFADIRVFATWA